MLWRLCEARDGIELCCSRSADRKECREKEECEANVAIPPCSRLGHSSTQLGCLHFNRNQSQARATSYFTVGYSSQTARPRVFVDARLHRDQSLTRSGGRVVVFRYSQQ